MWSLRFLYSVIRSLSCVIGRVCRKRDNVHIRLEAADDLFGLVGESEQFLGGEVKALVMLKPTKFTNPRMSDNGDG